MNERLVVVIPAASYALSVGSAPPLNEARGHSQLLNVSAAMAEWAKVSSYISFLNAKLLYGCFLLRIDRNWVVGRGTFARKFAWIF